MKTIALLFAVFLLSISCDLSMQGTKDNPSYTARIAWDSGISSGAFHQSHTVDGDSVYFYGWPPGYILPRDEIFPEYNLTRLDAETGSLIWRSELTFDYIVYCQPIVIGDYVFVFLLDKYMICFNKETGEHTAFAEVADIPGGEDFRIMQNITLHNQYLYFGYFGYPVEDYFVRIDATAINHDGDPNALQTITPEVLWNPSPKQGTPQAKAVIYNNVVYTSTKIYLNTDTIYRTVEIAGFDIDTKEMVFHAEFGGTEDGDVPFPETGGADDPILIHDGILYYLSWSISAWDLQTGAQLYRHVFTYDTPEPLMYAPTDITLQPVYYEGKIYYISRTSYTPDSHRNTHCIDAATGELVWNDIAKGSATLYNNPVIAHGRLYVPQILGFRVYDPATGALIGNDTSFHGHNLGRSVLYNDYLICIRDDELSEQPLVAVYVGK